MLFSFQKFQITISLPIFPTFLKSSTKTGDQNYCEHLLGATTMIWHNAHLCIQFRCTIILECKGCAALMISILTSHNAMNAV